MDSRAEPGHFLQVIHIHVFPTLCPLPQGGVQDTRSSGPHNHFLLPHMKANCIFVGLFRDQVFQVIPSAFLESLNIPGLLTYLS